MGQILSLTPRVLREYPANAEALERAEGVLLLAVRGWVYDVIRSVEPASRSREVMISAGAPDACMPLDLLMRVMARTAVRPLEVHRPWCPCLASDERRFLHAARLAQGGEGWMAEQALRAGMLSDEGASFALGPLCALGGVFAEAGLVLAPRAPPYARARAEPCPLEQPATPTLH